MSEMAERLDEEDWEDLARKGGAVRMTVQEWLGLEDAEMQLIEFQVALIKSIRTRRLEAGLSQAALAKRVGTKQPHIARIENGGIGVSLDLIMKTYFATGGKLAELVVA